MSLKRVTAAACTLLVVMTGMLRGQVELSGLEMQDGSGITMKVECAFDELPPSGFVPVRFRISNETNREEEWHVVFECRSGTKSFLGSEWLLRAPAGSRVSQTLLVPLPLAERPSGTWMHLALKVSGRGVERGIANHYSHGVGSQVPYAGFSESLYKKYCTDLRERIQKSGKGPLGATKLSPDFWQEDWRAYSGFARIWIRDNEWSAVPAATRRALRHWCLLGGQLCIVGSPEGGMDLPPKGKLGIGNVRYFTESGYFLGVMEKELLEPAPMTPGTMASQGYPAGEWEMSDEYPAIEKPSLPILLFMVAFAVIVGPVNLFWIAPVGRRHRLFLTIPLISLGASVLLFVIIVMTDGTGGRGGRFLLGIVDPTTRSVMYEQFQISRTGILIKRSFEVNEPVCLLPIRMHERDSVDSPQPGSGKRLWINGKVFSGDWFCSRRVQAHYIATATHSRGTITMEREGEGALAVTSSFEYELAPFYFMDSGRIWHADRLTPGQQTVLREVPKDNFYAWRGRVALLGGPEVRGVLSHMTQEGNFLAGLASPAFIPTLPSIRWEREFGVLTGPVEKVQP